MTSNTLVESNQLLAVLPQSEYQRLAPHLEQVTLTHGQVLYQPNNPIEDVYFPNGAVISLLGTLKQGATAEIAIVGSEGVVGIPVFLGGKSTTSGAIVQISGTATKLDANVLKAEFSRGRELQRQLLLYTQALFTQVAQRAVCRSFHPIEGRFARWLLTIHDCKPSGELPLTQKFISEMLGTRRASISEAASKLSQAHIIRYSRGKITIINRQALEARSCECYQLMKEEFLRLFGTEKEL